MTGFHRILALLSVSLCAGGCGELPASATVTGVRVVAAEDFWGSIARQLGGIHASVTSIIASPAQDPHSYEPTAVDARSMATAQLAIVNGLGYDPWAPRLLAADPADGRLVLTVSSRLGLSGAANPHRWYDPSDVERVAGAIAGALQRLDPRHATYFARRLRQFDASSLSRYHALIAEIRRRHAGVAVGASESVFAPLAPALGLRLITPPSFMRAIADGAEASAQDTATVERQITSGAIRLWVYNAQNVTPEIQRCNGLARAHRVPIATVTETPSPATASFERWQARQLQGIEAALHSASGG